MPLSFECPFYVYETGLRFRCDGMKIEFADAAARRSLAYTLCADPLGGWRSCPMYRHLFESWTPDAAEKRKNRKREK